MKKPLILLLLLLFSLLSCYKDELILDESTVTTIDHEEDPVSGHVVGLLTDEFGNVLPQHTTHTEGKSFESGTYGMFHFHLNNSDRNATMLNIERGEDLFRFSVKLLEDEVNYFRHSIFTQYDIKTASSQEALEITFSENSGINIEAGAYLLDGEAFTGEVELQVINADLNNPVHLDAIPGDRRSLDNEGKQGWLDYSQVIQLKLKAATNKLETKKGKAFVILEETCEDCVVWFYDENAGNWMIHRNEDEFDGARFDFTRNGFYALASAYPYNYVYGRISIGGKALINYPLDIYNETGVLQRVYTTNSGRWFTHLPINGTYSYRFTIAGKTIERSFQNNEEELILPLLELEPNELPLLRISGESRNCKDEALENHFLFVEMDGSLNYYFGPEPAFSIQLINNAEEEISIVSNDRWLEEAGPEQIYSADSEELILNKNFACNAFREGYFKLVLDGTERIFTIMESRLQGNRTKLIVYDEINLVSEFQISFTGNEPRNYNDNELNILFDQVELEGQTFEINCQNSTEGCGFESFKIEYYGEEKGDWIKGNFNGKFWVKTLDPLEVSFREISGEFMVPRTFS